MGKLLLVSTVWFLYYVSGHTLVSFASRVLILLLSILFFWSKAAAALNRPPPPIPAMNVSEEFINKSATLFGFYVNKALSSFVNVCRGQNPELYCQAAIVLLATSILGSFTDLVTFVGISLVIFLTVTLLIKKYEKFAVQCISRFSSEMPQNLKTDKECHSVIKAWESECKKGI